MAKKLCFDYPLADEESQATTNFSESGGVSTFKLAENPEPTTDSNEEIEVNPISIELNKSCNGASFDIGSENKLVYFTIHNCPANDDTKQNIYNSYTNDYGIDLDEYENKKEHRNYNFFNRCVKELDFALMCDLLLSKNIYEPSDYFAFYRDNLAIAFELGDINNKNYVDNAQLYSYRHIDCFNTLCEYRQYVIDHPNMPIPDELKSKYQHVIDDNCIKKFSRKSFNGVFCGNIKLIKRRSSNQNDFTVYTFKNNTVTTDMKNNMSNIHLPTNIKLSNEIQIRDVSSPTRFVKTETAERRKLGLIKLKPSSKTGVFNEAANDDSNGVYVLRGFNLKYDPDSSMLYFSFDKLITFIAD